jgi:single-stranded DNA-binding protein
MNEIPASFAGNIVRDPEFRFTGNGQAVVSLTVAVAPGV